MSDDRPVELFEGGETSLLETVDGLLNRGVVLTGDLVLGLADVDLVYLELTTLLAAADRVLGRGPAAGSPPAGGGELRPYTPQGPQEGAVEQPASATPQESSERVGEDLASSRAEAGPDARAATSEPADSPRIDALREELERTLGARAEPAPQAPSGDRKPPARWNAEPDDVERSVARLVLALVEFLRKLMERQAIRRMEEGTLEEEQVERLGRALMRLEETVHEMARRFGLRPEELNLDLGPLGRLT